MEQPTAAATTTDGTAGLGATPTPPPELAPAGTTSDCEAPVTPPAEGSGVEAGTEMSRVVSYSMYPLCRS